MVYWVFTGIILLILSGLIYLVPRRWSVTETALIQTSAERLYAFLLPIKNWTKWQMDNEEEIAFLYIGPEKGEGASVYWEADGVPANIRIYSCEHLKNIRYHMKINSGETLLHFKFELVSLEDTVKVIWICEGTSTNHPLDRFISLFYRWGVRREMKKALEKLSEVYGYQEKSLQTA